MFAELARTFPRMLELVGNSFSRSEATSAADVLALTNALQSRDRLAERQLRALGIDLQCSTRLQ